MKTHLFIRFFVLVGLITGLSFACSSKMESLPPDDSFQLIIFNRDWYDLNLGYQAQNVLPVIYDLEESESLFVISLDNIEIYNWDQQTITLTEDATKELAIALDNHVEDSEAVEALMGMRERLGWGNPWDHILYTKTFLVKVDNTPLYGGIFLHAVSQMAIDYPVIRLSVIDGKAVLSLLPVHIPFVMIDPIDGSGNLRETTLAQEAEQDAQEHSVFFSRVILDNSKKDVANEFRGLIRDIRIKRIIEAADKIEEESIFSWLHNK